jgi:hypothetical protein
LPSSNGGLNFYDISTTRSGDIILLGSRNSSTSESEMWITRLTKFGEIIWQKEFLAPGPQFCYKLNEHSSGYIGMAGSYRESDNMITYGWFILLNSEGLLDGCEKNYLDNSNATINPATYHFSDIDLGYIPASVNFIEGSMVESEGDAIIGNLCTGIPSDADFDGIPNEEEYGPSTQDPDYDGNDDGLPDALQNNVASFHTSDSSGYVTLEAPAGSQLTGVTAVDNPSTDDQPEEFEFPLGFFDFSVTGLDIGGSVSLNLFIPEGLSPVTYYKYSITTGNPDPHWYEFLYDGETGAEIQPGKIILNFRDGERGDEDLNQNDTIKDVGGPAIYEGTGIEYQSDRFTVHFRATIYPNPFMTSTRISFTLAEPVNVHIEIYDFLGRKIKTLVNEKMMAGDHELEFHPESLPGGIYYLHIEAGEFQDIQKMILLK